VQKWSQKRGKKEEKGDYVTEPFPTVGERKVTFKALK